MRKRIKIFALYILIAGNISFSIGQTPLRNLSINKNDLPHKMWTPEHGYPHASSNSEYPGDGSDPAFRALNAIDGIIENKGHGSDYPSWGPEKRPDLWWKVDFGENVIVSKVIIYIRSDFTPYTNKDHDGYWSSGKIFFSDSTYISINFKKTADAQIFEFTPKQTKYIKISDLFEEGILNWCGLTEVEVYGKNE
jgi:hypothetical protein